MTPPEPREGTPKSPPPPTAKRRVFPLGAKIACLVTGLVVLLVGGFGTIVARRAATLLGEEIDARGSQLARVLAEGLPRATHTEFGRTWSIMFEKPPVEDTTGEWQFRRQQERKAWLGTFEQLRRGGDLLNIVVLEGGAATLSAIPSDQFSFEPGEGSLGVCRLGSDRVPARRFRQAVPAPGQGKSFGDVDVFMSLRTVEQARSKMVGSIALLGGGAALVGVGMSLLVGGMVSRPLKTLAKDMTIVRTGDFEHRSTVSTADEIGVLAAAFNEMTAGLQQSERMRNDLRLAQEIQAKLLPRKLPEVPGFDLAARYLPATEVSGDYYDVFVLPDSRVGIAVGDVSGKGVGAGLIMTMTRALVRMGAQGGLSPKELLSQINAVLYKDLKRGAFVTLMYAVLDPFDGEVTIASAGHNPLCLWTPDKAVCAEVGPPGIALGVAAPELFDRRTRETTFVLPPRGRVVIYTDGVTEAMNQAYEQFGEERLRDVVARLPRASSEALLGKLVEEIDAHRRGASPWDDITVVALGRLADIPTRRPATGYTSHQYDGKSDTDDDLGRPSPSAIQPRELMRGSLVLKVEPLPDGVGLLRIRGSVDAHTFADFEQALIRLEKEGIVWIMADLSEMDYISSIGLNYLVNRRVHLLQQDGDLVLIKPQPAIAKILKMLGLMEVLRIVSSMEEAWALRKG